MSKMSQHFLNTADDRAASAEADNAYLLDAMLAAASRIERLRAALIERGIWRAHDVIKSLQDVATEFRIVAGEDAAKVAAAVADDIETGSIEF